MSGKGKHGGVLAEESSEMEPGKETHVLVLSIKYTINKLQSWGI